MFEVFWGVGVAFEVTVGVESEAGGRVAESDAEEAAEATSVV